MDRTTPTTHSGHDELLIARLYGGDVDASERARALDLMAECPDCAALFADLGSISSATAALPVPPRPRDFTLTAADAARLRANRRRWPALLRPELRRSLGGAMAVLGLVGVVLTGGLSAFGGSASTTALDNSRNALAADQNAAGAGAASPAAPQPAATAAPAALPSGEAAGISGVAPAASPVVPDAATAAPTQAGIVLNGGQGPLTPPEPSGLSVASTTNPEFAAQGSGSGNVSDGHTKSSGTPSSPATQASGSIDARVVWLAGFAILFGVGLAIMILPSLLRRRRRGSHT